MSFKRPDSDDEDGFYPRSTSSFSSSRHSKKDELARTLGSFAKDKFVSGSAQSQADFYGKQEVKEMSETNAPKELTKEERNRISAKILKAELKNDMKTGRKKLLIERREDFVLKEEALIAKLRKKLEGNDESRPEPSTSAGKTVVMMRRDRQGNVVPASRKNREEEKEKESRHERKHGDRRRRSRSRDRGDKTDSSTHSGVRKELEREQSLSEMMKEERSGTAEDQLRLFDRAIVSSAKIKRQDDESVDDIAEMQKKKKRHDEKDRQREEKKMRKEHNLLEKTLDNCTLCLESSRHPKHTVIAIGITTYLAIAPWEGLDDEHLLIVPQPHCASSIQLDEDVYREMRIWRKGLTAMWQSVDRDCVFMEMAHDVGANRHMTVEAVPLPKELGDVAPIYFKKAINECEGEYTDNKKLIELRDIRKQIPKGFSFFAIDFGNENGYAHVVENREAFPVNFGTEILAGMLDLPPNLWRKRKELSFDVQKERAKNMKEMWEPFDWTKKIQRD